MAPFPTRRISAAGAAAAAPAPSGYPPVYPPPPTDAGSPHISLDIHLDVPSRPLPPATVVLEKPGKTPFGLSDPSTHAATAALEYNYQHHEPNDDATQHILSAYSLGAPSNLIRDILELHQLPNSPTLQCLPFTITLVNWTSYLGNERAYPNFLEFFIKQIEAVPPSGDRTPATTVIEKFLFGHEGQFLLRSLDKDMNALVHISLGLEFGSDVTIAQGLAQAATGVPRLAPAFNPQWPPPPEKGSIPNLFWSALSKSAVLSSLFPPATMADQFAATVSLLPRTQRSPAQGLSGFTIVERMMNDPELAPGVATALNEHGQNRIDMLLQRRADVIRTWCDEWKFSSDVSLDYGEEEKSGKPKTPPWRDIVDKAEELMWIATVVYASSARPGYAHPKLDYHLMHVLTAVLLLPPLLEAISPHLRPALLHSYFRTLLITWVSRGRPQLHIKDTLLHRNYSPESILTNDSHPYADTRLGQHTVNSANAVSKALKHKRARRTEGKSSYHHQTSSSVTSEEVRTLSANHTPVLQQNGFAWDGSEGQASPRGPSLSDAGSAAGSDTTFRKPAPRSPLSSAPGSALSSAPGSARGSSTNLAAANVANAAFSALANGSTTSLASASASSLNLASASASSLHLASASVSSLNLASASANLSSAHPANAPHASAASDPLGLSQRDDSFDTLDLGQTSEPTRPSATIIGIEDAMSESLFVGNPWIPVLASAVDHPDKHLTKVIRALYYASTLYGQSARGVFHASLAGSEVIDGSIFIRAANMTMKVLGWAHEGERIGMWDRSCLGFDAAWEAEVADASTAPKGKGRAASPSPLLAPASKPVIERSRSAPAPHVAAAPSLDRPSVSATALPTAPHVADASLRRPGKLPEVAEYEHEQDLRAQQDQDDFELMG